MAVDNSAHENAVDLGVIGDFLNAFFRAGSGQILAEPLGLLLGHLFHSHRVNDRLQQVKCRGRSKPATCDVCRPDRLTTASVPGFDSVPAAGLEPAISGSVDRCFIQLSYAGKNLRLFLRQLGIDS